MAKNLNVSMTFTADTSQAKKEMKSLQDQLTKLGSNIDFGKGAGTKFVNEMREAQKSVAVLKTSLQSAFNMDTGKLDFTKFSASLKKGGVEIQQISKSLQQLGPEGQQAFLKLTQAVAQSEIPLIRVNDKLKSLGTTLANTARWQISSSVLHGFMGAIQTAYGYAQDLNRSLNDIRIVTGYSTDEMAKFAEQANKSAQALSTTTTAYTDAALIFYQQGLNDEEVQKRTDATIKMANVTGENAEHVSSYMTAIWNNFADGSKSLEYYADVMTQLGAATAASSEEIAEGMEKFAAVGETVGLSYEYAAAAVTTVIDKTRQSADIVGTSFKTIFARLEGLQLGETLEDGTTLNKYSKALATVGINIKEQNGELKDMDQILDEMGAKWETLSKDQQVALAQTVGGVRQYTQLIALLDNFDAFKENVQLGLDSEGTLQKQQDIYAESWEASIDRVRAAWEALYSDIIKDDFFIDLNNDLAKVLQALDRFVDSLGGVKGLLTAISPILWNIIGPKAIQSIQSIAYTTRMIFGGREAIQTARTDFLTKGLEKGKEQLGENSPQGRQYAAMIEYYQVRREAENVLDKELLEQYDLLQKMHTEQIEINHIKEKALELEKKKTEQLQNQFNLLQERLHTQIDKTYATPEGSKAVKGEVDKHINSITSRSAFFNALTVSDDEAVQIANMENVHKIFEQNPEAFRDLFKNLDIDFDKFNNLNFGTEGFEMKEDIKENVISWYKKFVEQFDAEFEKNEVAKVDAADKQEIIKALKKDELSKLAQDKSKERVKLANETADFNKNKQKEAIYLFNTKRRSYNSETFNEELKKAEEERDKYHKNSNAYKELNDKIEKAKQIEEEINKNREAVNNKIEELEVNYDKAVKQVYEETDEVDEIIDAAISKGAAEGRESARQSNQARGDNEKSNGQPAKGLREQLINAEQAKNAKVQVTELGTAITATASAVTGTIGLLRTWGSVLDGDTTIVEGLTTSIFSLVTIIPSVISMLSALQAAGHATKVAFGWITGITAAVGAIAWLWEASVHSRDQYYKDQGEQAQKDLDAAKAQQEENKAIQEYIATLEKAELQYKNNNITKEDYIKNLEETAKALEIENAELYSQIGAYEKLNQLIAEKTAAERRSARKENKEITQSGANRILSAANENATGVVDNAEVKNGKLQLDVDADNAEVQSGIRYLQTQGLSKYIKENKKDGGYNIDIDSMSSKDLAIFYEAISYMAAHEDEFSTVGEAMTELNDAIGAENIQNNIQALNESAKLIDEINIDEKLDALNNLKIEDGDYKTINEAWEKVLEDIPEGIEESDFKQAIIERLGSINPEMAANFGLVQEAADKLKLSMEDFLNLPVEQQQLVIQSLSKDWTGFAAAMAKNDFDITAAMQDIQDSFNLIDSQPAVTEVMNLVQALDSIKSGDVKTEEEWKELLGIDTYEKMLEAGLLVSTATGTMLVGTEKEMAQFQQDLQDLQYSTDPTEFNKQIEERKELYKQEIEKEQASLVDYKNSEINEQTLAGLGLDEKTIKRVLKANESLKWETIGEFLEASKDSSDPYNEYGIYGLQSDELYETVFTQTNDKIKLYQDEIAHLDSLKESYDAYAFTVETSYADIKKQVSQYGTLVNREEGKVQVAIRRSAQEYGLAADEIVEYGKYLDENNKYLKDNAIMADAVALAYSRADKGLQDLNSNFETWNKALADNTEDSKEYAEAMDGFETALQNIFNTEEDISNDFILSHLEDIQKAAEGDLEAITDLQIAFAQDANIDWNTLESRMGEDFQAAMDEVDWGSIEIGADVDTNPMLNKWFTAMNNMVMSGEMSADEMQSIWNSLGFELEPITKKITIASLQGGWWDGSKYVQPEDQVKEVVIGFKPKGSSYTGTNAAASKITNNNGGGKGGSSKGSKEKDYEKERYYTITRQIQDATDAFNEYEKAKDRAAGKAKVGYIDFELENLKERQRLQKEYLKEIEDYYKQDQAKLNFFGATYDENGVLTNYDEIFNRLQQKYKDAVASGSEEAINAAQQDMDAFIAAANQYDKTNQLYQSELIKDAELAREEIDKTIEKIDTTLTLKVEIDDRSLKLLEYQLGRIEGGAFTQGAQMANRQAQLNLQLDEQAATRQALDDLLKENKLTENDLATKTPEELVALGIDDKVIAKMKEYADKLLEIQGNIDGLEEAILGGALEAFEEFNAEFDYQSKIIEHQTKLLKSYKDIAELVYGNAGLDEGFMIDLMGTSQETMLARTAATRTKLEADKQALAKAREAFANYSGGDEKVKKQLEEDVRSMEETVMQGEEDLLSQTQENLQQAKEIFDRTLEAAKQDYLKAVGADDWSMTLFDRATKIDDQYLDDYEKIYHLAKLTRDVNNSIDDTPAFRGKERLREVTEEILELEKEGVKVSQYQVDALRAKYELRLAEIALEDSQNAKSTVRMARDNEGNWSYVYTSDADDVDKAKQNYEDKLYEYQKLNTDYVKKQQKTYMDLAREAGDAIKQIADNSKLDPAVQDEMIAETEAYYAELMGITTSELELALGYNKDLYEKDWASYNKYTGYKISADQNYIDKFDETILGEITGLKSTQEAYQNWADALAGDGGFIPAVGNALDDLAEAQNRALEILGTDLDDFAGHVGAAMTNAIDETENAKNAIEDNAKQMEDFFNSLADAIKKLNDLRINDMRDDTTNLINNINSMIKAYNELAEAKQKASDVPSTGDTSGYDQSSLGNSGGNGNSSGNGSNAGDEPYLKNNTITALNGYGGVDPVQNMLWRENNPVTLKQLKNFLTSSAARVLNVDPIIVNGIRKAKKLKEFGDFLLEHGKQEDFKKLLRGNSEASDYGLPTIGFDTGGYTGSWGDSGRLAFLHQKELVLNAQDTANMLQMTNMVRELSEYIDFQAAATNLGRVSTTIGSVGALAGGELNQNVRIEATFPNVSEAYEIEEALTSLVNRAAQYANRK